MIEVRPFGEAALLVELEDAGRAQALRRRLLESGAPVTRLVPGRSSLLVEFDPLATDPGVLRRLLRDLPPGERALRDGRGRRIPVAYGGAQGPDLADVAGLVGLEPDAVVARHVEAEHRVAFVGFAPGFAYLDGLPADWRIPRLATPRTRVPAGSVAVADGMTGIYPADLPGGWRIIGWTPISLFDLGRERPAYLEPGDRVRFEPISADAAARLSREPGDW